MVLDKLNKTEKKLSVLDGAPGELGVELSHYETRP